MIKTIIKNSYESLDQFVSILGNDLHVRLKMDYPRRLRNEHRTSRYFEKIRSAFTSHKPSIHIGNHIGTGGFADVFKAKSNYNGITDFAIKILRQEHLKIRSGPEIDRQEEMMRVKDIKKRFSNESYIQWHLSKSVSPKVSESVVKVYDHGEFDSKNGFRFILMEQMGSTLRNFIEDKRNFSSDYDLLVYKTVLMTKIADIISNVHSEGVFHRDIKPENIFFSKRKVSLESALFDSPAKRVAKNIHVKLGDFGTVRWVRSYNDKFDGIIIGSQLYMSPEQILSPQLVDLRTDIYSFGIVCYELIYGRHPKNIRGKTNNLLKLLVQEKPVQQTPPEGFEKLNDIIFTCMNDLKTRFQNMGEVAARLREFSFSLVNGEELCKFFNVGIQ